MARNPLTAVPATRSSLPLLRIRRRAVLGVLLAAAVTGPITAVVAATHHTPTVAPVVLPHQIAVSLGQTVATDFLAARKSAVPAAKNVSNDFTPAPTASKVALTPLNVQSLAFAGSAAYTLGGGADPTEQIEQETYDAVVGGQLLAVTVPMTQVGASWVLGAAPAIVPAPVTANQAQAGIDYSGLYPGAEDDSSLLPSAGYTNQIAAWATTFASAGHASQALLALTGDTSARTYSGLGGWTSVATPVIETVVPVTASAAGPVGFIVRVGLVLRSPAANGPTLSTEYDLYLESDVSQTLPPVIAWGPAGSYRSLQPYANADQH